ncbi:MAG TPA: lysozyme inhibitor LprI family protein, partial [Sphingomicrobium sp.]
MIALLFLAGAVAPLTAKECKNAQAQNEMTMCARQDFEKADAELNRLWTKLIADARKCDKSPDCGRTASDQRSEEGILKQGQRAWV